MSVFLMIFCARSTHELISSSRVLLDAGALCLDVACPGDSCDLFICGIDAILLFDRVITPTDTFSSVSICCGVFVNYFFSIDFTVFIDSILLFDRVNLPTNSESFKVMFFGVVVSEFYSFSSVHLPTVLPYFSLSSNA